MALNNRRWLALTAGLAVCIAVWEVDPRWITDHIDGLNTLEQSTWNQNQPGGSQRIIWVAGPLTALLGLLVWRVATPGQTTLDLQHDWLGLWLAWSVVGAFFGPSPLLGFAFSTSFAIVAVATRSLTRQSPTLTAVGLILGLGFFLAISVGTKVLGLTSFTIRSERLTFLSLDANQLGRTATIAAIAGLFLAFESEERHWRIVGALAAPAGLAAVTMTGSRTGFLATGVALFVLLVAKRSRLGFGFLVVIAIATTVLISATGTGRNSLDSLLRDPAGDEALTTLTGRTAIWPVAVDVILEQPLAGHGLGTTTRLLASRSADTGFVAEHAHNTILHFALTTGVIGTALLLAAIFVALRNSSPRYRPWVLTFVAYFFIAGITEAVFRNPDSTLVALVFILTLANKPADDNQRLPHDCAACSAVSV
jgi:O-antigen ligase